MPKYWLGVQCRPVDESLRAHLDLPKAQGLVVVDVVSDSPAASAGIELHDVILSANGKPLSIPSDLVASVEAVAEGSLSLKLLRSGELKTVAATPSRRPKEATGRNPATYSDSESSAFRKWIEELQGEPGRSMRFRFIHPGMILPPDAPCHPPLPEDVTVSIVKRGGQPTRVTITRANGKWEVTENELDTLPQDVRRYAEQMLGRTIADPVDSVRWLDFIPDWAAQPSVDTSSDAVPEGAVEQRLDAMIRQLDQLRRAMEQLQKEQPRKPTEK